MPLEKTEELSGLYIELLSKIGEVIILIGILGSCVTRDAFQLIHDQYQLSFYIARSSIASIYSPAINFSCENLITVKNSSNFGTKMVKYDLFKTGKKILCNNDYHVLIIDLIDERFDLIIDGDSIITDSNYLRQTDLYERIKSLNKVTSHEEKFNLWTKKVDELMTSVNNKKILLHRAKWANRYKNHDTNEVIEFRDNELSVVTQNNAYLERCYDYINSIRCDIINIYPQDDLVYSDFKHIWGKDYFHFGHEYYQDIAEKIKKELLK